MNLRRVTTSRCCCRGCGEFFNSVSAFDWHRATPASANGTPRVRSIRRCLTVKEMLSKGMTRNPRGYWIKQPRAAHRIFDIARRISAGLASDRTGLQGQSV